jgi:uncharacterized protein (TIGR03437 family)
LLLEISFLIPLGLDASDDSSYFKFNLDYINLYNLIRLDSSGNSTYRAGYATIRQHTASHQNAFFDMIDRGLNGPDPVRDARAMALLDQWLERPRRDVYVDLSGRVPVCGSASCRPIPVPWRVPTDFLWQRSPFQLAGGGQGLIETAGIDYVLPYWMSRYYGVSAAFSARSAASGGTLMAPGSLVSLYGSNLASGVAQASGTTLPQILGGISVQVTGSDSVERAAGLFYVSAGQVNLMLPPETPAGMVTLVVAGPSTLTGAATAVNVSPGLFSMNANGTGVAAATAVRVTSGSAGAQTPVTVFTCQATCAGVPIMVTGGDNVFITLYATGVRNRSGAVNVTVQAGGMTLPVLYAGAQPQFAGLDQVNFLLPPSLAGRGEIPVTVTADGVTSNAVTLAIQ